MNMHVYALERLRIRPFNRHFVFQVIDTYNLCIKAADMRKILDTIFRALKFRILCDFSHNSYTFDQNSFDRFSNLNFNRFSNLKYQQSYFHSDFNNQNLTDSQI